MTEIATGAPAESSAAGETRVHVQEIVTQPTRDPSKVRKVFVAVHGIGDQYTYATIQSVVNQVCTYYGKPAAVPLGSFHTGDDPFSLVPPYEPDPFEQFSFAEVYWAGIPREFVKDHHKLEEIKQWARTLVERLRLRWKQVGEPDQCRDHDFALTGQILGEMVQTVSVLDRLTFLANRAGLFTFDLKKLLDDFVGDVQIVTEFKSARNEILTAFDAAMKRAHRQFPEAEIHVIAHSEGTVVAFLALLEAFRDPARPEWARRVRGMMTIGSPIDKHLLLWPGLFARGNISIDRPAWIPEQPISWRNYYDHGDPVGFELNDVRAWLRKNGWDGETGKVFEFGEEHDMGFSRYPLPGHAHVAYWNDPAVFGHFIATVVNKDASGPDPRKTDFQKPPASIWWKQALAYLAPYAAISALFVVAAYIVCRATISVIDPGGAGFTHLDIAKHVGGVAALMLGVTVAGRIPRLTRDLFWRIVALCVGASGAVVYLWCIGSTLVGTRTSGGAPSGLNVLLLSLVLVAIVWALGVVRPGWGSAPLVVLGTLAVGATAAYFVIEAATAVDASGQHRETGPLWPLTLALLGCLYLWWLAALFFDLVFVWHRYIRHSKALAMMDYVLGGLRPASWGGRGREAMTPDGAPHLQVR